MDGLLHTNDTVSTSLPKRGQQIKYRPPPRGSLAIGPLFLSPQKKPYPKREAEGCLVSFAALTEVGTHELFFISNAVFVLMC